MNKLILTTLIGIAMGTASAQAIVYYANTDLTTAPAGTTFTAVGGSLGTKDQAGYTVLGVTGGPSGNEIDIGEELIIEFADAQVFTSLSLGLLFDGLAPDFIGEYGDKYEIAAALTNGEITPFTLTATGLTSAEWRDSSGTIVPGAVTNISPSDTNNAAVWSVANPFGNLGVTKLTLYPLSSAPTINESDFGLHAFRTTAVPDGGITLMLLGLGLAGLAIGRRWVKA